VGERVLRVFALPGFASFAAARRQHLASCASIHPAVDRSGYRRSVTGP